MCSQLVKIEGGLGDLGTESWFLKRGQSCGGPCPSPVRLGSAPGSSGQTSV